MWVPSHSGIEGNEKANSLANLGSNVLHRAGTTDRLYKTASTGHALRVGKLKRHLTLIGVGRPYLPKLRRGRRDDLPLLGRVRSASEIETKSFWLLNTSKE